MSIKKPKYPELNLSEFKGMEEKFVAVFNFLQITTVFCELKKEFDPNPMKTKRDLVTKITIPKGETSYIHSLVKEIRKILIESIDKYLEDPETTLFEMIQSLKKIKDRCVLQIKMHNIKNTMEYEPDRILFQILKDSMPVYLYFDHLAFTKIAQKNLEDHFYIREEFYKAMTEILDSRIVELSEPSSFTKQPYIWNSDHAKYEIGELLYALLGTRIKVKEGERGAHAKLVKNSYNLFGYDVIKIDSKSQQVRNRKLKKSWLQELPDYVAGLRKNDDPTKNFHSI